MAEALTNPFLLSIQPGGPHIELDGVDHHVIKALFGLGLFKLRHQLFHAGSIGDGNARLPGYLTAELIALYNILHLCFA